MHNYFKTLCENVYRFLYLNIKPGTDYGFEKRVFEYEKLASWLHSFETKFILLSNVSLQLVKPQINGEFWDCCCLRTFLLHTLQQSNKEFKYLNVDF